MADDEYQTAAAGASETYPEQCSKLRKNGYVMIKDRPCKVVEMSTSKTGKHGHAKVHYVGLDIFTGKKYEDICPSTHSVNVPNVSRGEQQVMDVDDDGYLEILKDDGSIEQFKCEIDTPKAVKEKMEKLGDEENMMAVILKACGQEKVMELKSQKSK